MLGKSARIPVLQRINHQEADLKDSQFWQNQLGHVAKINQHYFEITGVSKEDIVSLINRENNQEKYLSPLEVNPAVVALFEDKTIEVSEGEKIRLTTTDKDRNIANNDRGMIKRIEDNKLYIELTVSSSPINHKRNMLIDIWITPMPSQVMPHKALLIRMLSSMKARVPSPQWIIPMWNYPAQKNTFSFIYQMAMRGWKPLQRIPVTE